MGKIKKVWITRPELDDILSGWTPSAIIDIGDIGGLIPGSIPFADASGFLTEDNAALFWDAAEANLGIGTNVFGATMTQGLQIATGLAPTANVADTFAFYSADFAPGNACPHFRTEDGTVIGLNQGLLTTDNVDFGGITVVNAITEFSIDGTMAGNSDSALPTEKAVVSYVKSFHELTNEPTGFENRTASTLSWGGVRTLTISPSAGSFDFYQEGTKYTKNAPENIQIADTSGVHYIYYDAGTLTISLNPSQATLDTIYETKPLVALIYWNATDGAAYFLGDERHGLTMDGVTHRLMHNTEGALWGNGLTLSGYTLDTASDAALNFEVTDGEFFDQDITLAITDGAAANQYEQQLNGGDAVVPILYRDDIDGTWKEDAASTLPYKVTGSGRLAYNNDDGDGTFSQIEVTDNKFMSVTLVATNDWQYPIKMIQGQNEYTDKKTAVEEALSEILSFGDLPTPEMTFLYRLVMQTKDTFGGAKKAKIVDVTDLRGSLVTGATAVAVDHGVLSGLADDDHSQYLLVDGTRAMTGALNMGSQNIGSVGTIGCGTITVVDGSSINLQEDIAFTGATTENQVKFPDNLPDALSFMEGVNPYQTFITDNGNEAIQFHEDVLLKGSTEYGATNKTTGAWTKSIGGGGDYADWATMIAAMPDLIAHAVTVTIEAGTTLTEICDIKNKHGVTSAGIITIVAEKYFPTTGAIPTADSATATTLRDAALAIAALGNDYFNGCWIFIVDGTGTDNGFVLITDYIDATGDVVVAAWPGTQPDNTSRYLIVGALIDGGSARQYGFDFTDNLATIYMRGIGVKDATFYGINCYRTNFFFPRYTGIYNCSLSGIYAVNVMFLSYYNGIVKTNTTSSATNAGITLSGVRYVELGLCGISDNNVQGILATDAGGVSVIFDNFGDGNGNWGTYASKSGQASISGGECSGAAGNHSDPGTAGNANADQASAY